MLHLTILTPTKVLVDVAEVTKVRFKLADDAWLSIYPHHLPLIAETLPEPLSYITGGDEHTLTLAPGIVHVVDDTVTLFTSGLAGTEAETSIAAPSIQEFDRLAQTLFATLGAQFDPEA